LLATHQLSMCHSDQFQRTRHPSADKEQSNNERKRFGDTYSPRLSARDPNMDNTGGRPTSAAFYDTHRSTSNRMNGEFSRDPPSRQRPLSATAIGRSNATRGGSTGAGILRPQSSRVGGSYPTRNLLSAPTVTARSAGINSGGLENRFADSAAMGRPPKNPLLGQSDSEDEADMIHSDNDEEMSQYPEQRDGVANDPSSAYIQARIVDKKNERLEGIRGAGVGSLLDTEIRKIQVESTGEPVIVEGQRKRHIGKKVRKKNLTKKSAIPFALSSAPLVSHQPVPDKMSTERSTAQKKKEMCAIYTHPVMAGEAADIITQKRANTQAHNAQLAAAGFERVKALSALNKSKESGERRRVVPPHPDMRPKQKLVAASKSAPTLARADSAGAVVAKGANQMAAVREIKFLNPGVLF
jgi:hypothetical protein